MTHLQIRQHCRWSFLPDGFPEVVPDNPDDWPVLPYGFFDGRLVTDIAPTGGRQRTFESLPDDIVEGRVRGTTIVADHTKIGQTASFKVCSLEDIQMLIADKISNQDLIDVLKKKRVAVR